MDIDTLHQAGLEAGINFLNEDSVQDCLHPWVLACLGNKDFMEDYLGDLLCGMTTPTRIEQLIRNVPSALRDAQWLQDESRRYNVGLTTAYADSLSNHCSAIGGAVLAVLEEEVRKVVKDHLHDWFNDCRGYHIDMEQGRKSF